MKTALLRLATRDHDGSRRWACPGFDNEAILRPASRSFWPDAASFSWPCMDPRDPHIAGLRTARADWYKSIIRAEVRKLIAAADASRAKIK